MKKLVATITLIWIIAGVLDTMAQVAPKKYAVYFTDKNNNPYSIYNPAAFLSPRALERRAKYDIEVNEQDLPITPSYLDSIRNTGVIIQNYSRWLNAVVIVTDDTMALQKIASFPFVQKKTYVGMLKPPKTPVKRPLSRPHPDAWNRKSEGYGLALNQIAMVNGVGLHQRGFTGKEVWIAVFDGGFLNATTHPGLLHIQEQNRLLAVKDFTLVPVSPLEDGAHGTQCLSVIAANDPGQMIGTAPDATFILCRTEELISEYVIEEYNWVAAAEYADSIGVDVISSSLGYAEFDDSTMNHTYADMNGTTCVSSIGASMAAARGILVCNSAGNQGEKAWRYITAPSDAADIFCVGAVNAERIYAPFSSHGYSADGRVKPEVMAQGAGTTIANPYNGNYTVSNGTSFSNPVIAGMVACLRQAHPDKSVTEIIQAVVQSADRYTNPDTLYGYGIPDFQYADMLLSKIDIGLLKQNEYPVIYPNPMVSSFTLVHYSTQRSDAIFQMYDATGRLWLQDSCFVAEGFNQFSFNIPQFSAGLYIVRFVTDDKTYELKVIKSN